MTFGVFSSWSCSVYFCYLIVTIGHLDYIFPPYCHANVFVKKPASPNLNLMSTKTVGLRLNSWSSSRAHLPCGRETQSEGNQRGG